MIMCMIACCTMPIDWNDTGPDMASFWKKFEKPFAHAPAAKKVAAPKLKQTKLDMWLNKSKDHMHIA